MPLDANILGFSNRWYRSAMEASVTKKLRTDLEFRMVTAPYFVATKLEAFQGRGGGDFLGSHDLEDVVSVVDGRETLSAEVRAAGTDLSEYVRREIAKLLANRGFIDALPGFLLPDSASQSRIGMVLERLHDLTSI
jgi:predicted nucleotidyltransferase